MQNLHKRIQEVLFGLQNVGSAVEKPSGHPQSARDPPLCTISLFWLQNSEPVPDWSKRPWVVRSCAQSLWACRKLRRPLAEVITSNEVVAGFKSSHIDYYFILYFIFLYLTLFYEMKWYEMKWCNIAIYYGVIIYIYVYLSKYIYIYTNTWSSPLAIQPPHGIITPTHIHRKTHIYLNMPSSPDHPCLLDLSYFPVHVGKTI